jgi:hypothetical protein
MESMEEPKKRLLVLVREAMRRKHYSERTEEAHIYWDKNNRDKNKMTRIKLGQIKQGQTSLFSFYHPLPLKS